MNDDLQAIYYMLEGDRSQFLEVAYRSSVLTIPSLLPRDGARRHSLPQNYQSVGARGVNNLSSKLKLVLFPVDLPLFRLNIDPFAERALVESLPPEEAAQARAEITKNLSLIEETGRQIFVTDGWVPKTAELLRHLVVTGNGAILDDPKRGPQFIDLRKFVVERDPEGTLLKCVVRQGVSDEVAFQVTGIAPKSDSPEKRTFLFTGAVLLDSGKYAFWQQVDNIKVPESYREYEPEELPLMPFRFTEVSGENYGTGYVDEYNGDFVSLEALSRAMTEGALAAAKLLMLVRPGSSTRIATIATSPNGAVRAGSAEDVTVLTVGKQGDFSTAERRAAIIEQRLSNAFLLFSSVVRQAERVTTEEIRMVSQELEDALGGVYSSLGNTLQKPIVDYILAKLRKRKDMPKIPPTVRPSVSTGLDAISRGSKAIRLSQFGSTLQSIVGPEESAMSLRADVVARELAVAFQLDPDALIRSKEELEEMRTSQSNQSLVESLGPQTIQSMSRQQPQ